LHEYDRAIQDLDEAIRLYPKDADAFHNRGSAHLMKGENDLAAKDFVESLRLNPIHAGALKGLAVVGLEQLKPKGRP